MSDFISIQPGDIIAKAGRVWRVTGVHLGCVGQENIVTMEATDRKPGYVSARGPADELRVPLDMLDRDTVFRKVDHDAARTGLRAVAN